MSTSTYSVDKKQELGFQHGIKFEEFWNLRSFWKRDITSLFRENQFSGLIEFANINFTNIIAVSADLAPTLAIITAITVI